MSANAPAVVSSLPRLLTVSEVAELFQVSEVTVWRWARTFLTPIRIGGSTRWREDAILELLTPAPGKPAFEIPQDQKAGAGEK